jgi:hypothetical protein
MKKMFFASLLVLASSQAAAGLMGSITHDYGVGKFNPAGNDQLITNSVVVSDQSSGRFSDVFDFSAIGGTISALELVLDYSHAGPRCPWGLCFLGETWEARLQGSDSSAYSDDLFVNMSDALSPQSILLTSASDSGAVDVWSHTLSQGSLGLWFSESSWFHDAFALNSATLNVFGEADTVPVSVPEPSSMALIGLGLAGLAVSRRRRTSGSAVTK